MLKRILLLAVALPTMATGCIVEHRRPPRTVQPSYVAQCPAGYRYDGYNCRRIHHHAGAAVRVYNY